MLIVDSWGVAASQASAWTTPPSSHQQTHLITTSMIHLRVPQLLATAWCVTVGVFLPTGQATAQAWLDNNRDWNISSLNPNVNSRSSDHFRIFWGNADNSNADLNTDFSQVSEQLAQGNLQMLEIQWHILHDPIASGGMGIQAPAQSANSAYWDGNSYRDTLGMNQTGLWGGGAWGGADAWGFPIFGLPPSYLRFDPPSGATPHEYGHTVFITAGGFNNTPYDGMWHEAMANWLELQIDNDYPTVGNTVLAHAGSLPHGRDYYDAWPIFEYLKDDPRWGSAFINTVMTQGHGNQSIYNPPEYIFDAMARLNTSGAVDSFNDIKDALGNCHAHCLTWDFKRGQLFKSQAPLTSDFFNDYYRRGFTELEKRPGSVASGNQSAWYRVPWSDAPSQGGFDFIPIALNGKVAGVGGYQVGVNFQPLWDGTRGSDWRATLVAVDDNNAPRYSQMWNCGVNSITLSGNENKLYLVVAATPRMLGFEGFSTPLVMDPVLQPQAFEIAFVNTTAGPYESNPAATQSHSSMTQHANGGGWKSNSATVDATAYIGPNALVLDSAQVRGNARVEDYAVVRGTAQVRDNAIVSGHALVRNSAQVYGNARIRDWATVINATQVYGDGKVLERAFADNDNIRDNGTVKGWTYDYVDSGQTIQGVYGYAIKEGDCANGSTIDHGVLTCWRWGFDQGYADSRPDIGWRYCEYHCENYSPIYAKDTYGMIHGVLMGGTTKPTTVASGNTARGKVLALNGTDQYVELHKDVCDFRDCTISAWVKWIGGSSDQVIWSMGDGANKYMTLTAQGSTSQLRFAITNTGSGGETALTTTTIPADTWSHVAVTFSSGMVNLYVNGTAAASGAFTLRPCDLMGPNTVNGGNCNYIGRGNAGNYFAGQIDLFAVYVKALSTAEVTAIAANTGSTTSIPPQTDTAAPTANPPTWLQSPTALDESTIQMSANVGTDASGSVEYYFTCTSGGGHDSGWISSNRYTDCALTLGASCSYTVMMRDRWGNTTATSSSGNVSATADSGAPTPNPATFAYGPVGTSTTSINMTATKGTCSGGLVEYNFTRVSGTGGPASSGWQSSPTWTATGLTSAQSYSYTVQMRNIRGATGTASTASTALLPSDTTAPTLYTLGEWGMRPYATIDNCVSMTARAITDSGGVQYSFECTSGGGPSSGWITSNIYKTTAVADGTYTYRFRVRQQNATANVTGYSQAWSATINPTTGYHACTISNLATLQDHYLASFSGTVMRVNTDSYDVKDLASGATIGIRPATARWVTDPSLALKNVTVKGHLFTYSGTKWVNYATVTSNGTTPTLYNISGRVINAVGTGIAGATVSFSDVADASAHAIVTTTTDSSGNYSRGVTTGTWYVAASSSAYNSSADQVVTVNTTAVPGVNFTLVSNANVTGTVTRRSDGTPVSGASVYFSRSAGASASPVFTVTTDASGNYTKAVQDGVWYVAAGATGLYTSTDKTITVNGVSVSDINFSLKSDVRNIPRTSDLLFSAVTDSLPASGATGNWPTYLPAGQTLTQIGSPTVEISNGVKWVKNNRMTTNDGFRQGGPYTSIPCNGVTIIAAVKPTYCSPGGEARGEIVDIMYNRLALAVSHADGRIMVCRNYWNDWGPAIPNNTAVILSLVVQPDGSYVVYSNGTSVMTGGANGSFSTPMVPNGTEDYKKYVNVGRNNPDGWSAFNGNIGDVFVYNVALTPTERQQLETDVTAKFLSTDYTVTATPGAGGTINPSGAVSINPGGSQTFTIAPLPGYVLNTVTVDGVPQGAIGGYTFSNVTANHTISATYSAIVLVPTTTLARHPGTGSSSTYGDSLSFDVTCAGTPVPTGTVTLRDGGTNGTIIGSGTLSGGTCTITPALTALTAGNHNNLMAVYAGDGIIPAMNSNALDTQSVSPKTLTVTGMSVISKPYDGNTTATLTGTPVLNGLVDSDTLTLGNTTSGTFADPNAGTAKPVDTTMTLSGSAATNYSLTKPVLTGTITPRIVTLGGSRAYDGTTSVAAANLTVSNKVAGDDLTLTGSTALAGKNAETQTILLGYATPMRVQSKTGAVGTTAANSFTVSMTAPTSGNTLVAVVSTRSTTASAVTSISNTGTALAWARAVQTTPSSSTTTEIWYAPVLSGAGTDITINLSASIFAAAVVGEYSGVLTPGPVDVTANNSNGSNSTATSTGTTATTTQANEVWIGGIGLRSSGYTLGTPTNSFTAVTNASSGSTTATNNARVYFLEKIVSAAGTANSGGTTTSSRWSGAIATFKASSTSSLALSGTAAGNYTLTGATGSVTVTPKALTVGVPVIASRVYNATTTAGAVTVGTLSGFIGTETVTTTATAAAYSSTNAGSYPGTVVTYTLSNGTNGGLAANYSLPNGTATGEILPKALTGSGLAATNKEYDGTPVTNLTGTAALLDAEAAGNGTTSDGKPYTGDSLTLSGTAAGAFANHDAGDGKPVTVTGVTLIGAQANNYSLTQQTGLTANVTPRPLAVTATGPAKAYGMALTTGTSTTNFTAGVAGATGVGSETVTGVTLTPDAAGLSATTAAGSAYVVTPSLATGTGGFSASNYQITYTPYTGTVAKAQATVTLGNLAHAYDGAPKSASATTNPAGLAVDLTYNGFTDPPSAIGSYDVVATVNNSNYTGTASDTLFIAEEAIIAWRKVHFSPQEIADGLAADHIDADGDGAINLIEFAFNGDPRDGASSGMFFTRLADGADGDLTPELTLTCAVRRGAVFAPDAGHAQVTLTIDGLVYTIEGSRTLIGAWDSEVIDQGASDAAPAGSTLSGLGGTGWQYHTFSAFNGLSGMGFLRTGVAKP